MLVRLAKADYFGPSSSQSFPASSLALPVRPVFQGLLGALGAMAACVKAKAKLLHRLNALIASDVHGRTQGVVSRPIQIVAFLHVAIVWRARSQAKENGCAHA